MNEPSQLDIAELKYNMRQMYKQIGLEGSLQVVYEMMVGARTLLEVITEEQGAKR